MSRTRLQITTTTWNRDSNGLFDYDSRSLFHQTFRTGIGAQVVRTDDHCQLSRLDSSINGEGLVTVAAHMAERYVVQECKGRSRLWVVAKSLRGRIPGVELTQGDILRLGKVSLVVKRTSQPHNSSPNYPKKRIFHKQDISENIDTHSLNEPCQCRICLGEASTPDNPFIAPCACDGSMKHIHLQCLREWLKSKLSVRESGAVITYSWQQLQCELCKENLPESVRCGADYEDLLDFHKPEIAYLMLEDLNMTHPDSEKFMHVISLYESDSIRIVITKQGRGHDSEIRINDISVSRLHATIKLAAGHFYLEDRSSKFGTLVQARAGLVVSRTEPCSVQVGRTVLDFEVVLDVGSVFRCCLCCCPRSAAVAPAAETFAENEREGQEEEEDQENSGDEMSRRSVEVASAAVPRTSPDVGIMGNL